MLHYIALASFCLRIHETLLQHTLKHFYIMKQITENTILLMLLLIGGIGLLLHYNNKTAETNNDFEIVLLQNGLSDASSHEQSLQKTMKISGPQEVGLPLDFEINNPIAGTHYFLELGNGKSMKVTKSNNSYTYPQPGYYDVKLIAVNNGQSTVMQSTKIRITQQFAAGPTYGGSQN